MLKSRPSTFALVLALAAWGLALAPSVSAHQTPNSSAKPSNITILTGSPGGTWPAQGAAIAQIFAEHGVNANAEVGAALSNVVKLAAGRGELGFTYSIVPAMAKNSEEPFKKPITNVRGVAALFQSWHHVGVRKGTGVDSVADLEGRKYASQAVGNASQVAFAHLLKAYGLTEDDLDLSRGSQAFGASATKDRNVVGWAALSAVPTGLWAEAFTTVDMKLLGLPLEKFQEIKKMNEGWIYSEIPAGTYEGVTENVPVISSYTIMVAPAELPDEDVYWAVKTMLAHLDEIRQVHASFRDISPKSMADIPGVELHPGAKRAYEEAGALP